MNKTFLDLTEWLLEKIEDIRLLKLADSRINDKTTFFESFVNEQGFSWKSWKIYLKVWNLNSKKHVQ